MEKLQSKTPQIRFPEFNDAWEHKFGNEVFKSISDKNHNSDLPILAISQEFGAVPRELINYQISVTEKSIKSYKVIEVGDFIISLRSFQGGIEYSNYKGICSPAYIILRPFTEVDRRFFKYYFKTYKYIQHLNKKLEGIRDGKMISYKYFSEIAMPFPSIPEQTRIASFFTVLDKKITQLKQKKSLLEQYKKGVMQKIFSQELRFKDDNGKVFPKWEKKKLGGITTKISDGLHSTPIYDDEGDYYFVNGNNLIDGKVVIGEKTKRVSESEYLKHKKDLGSSTILLSINGTIGSLALYDNEKIILGKSACYINVKEEVDKLFVYNSLQTPEIINLFTASLTGTTIKNLSLTEIKNCVINLPSKEEQIKISNFLSVIDEKINRTENQIQQTQEYKKGLLQRMFC